MKSINTRREGKRIKDYKRQYAFLLHSHWLTISQSEDLTTRISYNQPLHQYSNKTGKKFPEEETVFYIPHLNNKIENGNRDSSHSVGLRA